MATGDGASDADDDDQQSDQPEQKPSQKRLADHTPDAYTVGYDEAGNTRVGIGTADGDIRRLLRHNEGRHQSDGQHSAREAARDKKRITQSLCSELDLPKHQQQEATSVMGRLNLDRFGSQKRLEKVALCVIQFVVDRDRQQWFLNRQPPEEHDLTAGDFDEIPRFATDPDFQQLCAEKDVSDKDRFSISQLIKRELKKQGYFNDGSSSLESG